MLVGEAFSGKSSMIKVLSGCFRPTVQLQQVNPKAISTEKLYGRLDEESRVWSDGVVPIILREWAKSEKDLMGERQAWMIFDGPVDDGWAMNLNSVLDDNKKLCLTSGETIKLTK